MSHVMNNTNDIKHFVKAGRAVFTLRSQKTGNHMVFKLLKFKKKHNQFFVYVRVEHSFKYMGMVVNDSFRLTQKSSLPEESIELKTFQWFIGNISRDTLPGMLEFRHENQCGRCGRDLTTPESIDRGIGPECIKKI